MRRVLAGLLLAGCFLEEPLVGDSMGNEPPYLPVAELAAAEVAEGLAFCVEETNRYRALVGLGPLSRSAEMEAYAAEGAKIDAYAAEPHFHFRTMPFQGEYRLIGENELRNWSRREHKTVREVIRKGWGLFWAEGPGGGHHDNLVAEFTEVGCGVHFDVPTQTITVVQDLRGL
jgi:hypothetical protein